MGTAIEYRAEDYTSAIRHNAERASSEVWAEGTAWYRTAHGTAADFAARYGTSVDTAARVIAVLSPRKRWAENVEAARIILSAYADGQTSRPEVAGIFRANLDKAWRIVNGDPDALSGPKVTRFYQNIMGTEHEVTLDVWAMRGAGSDLIAPNGPNMYAAIAEAYCIVAAEWGVSPSALQAVVWTVVRGSGI